MRNRILDFHFVNYFSLIILCIFCFFLPPSVLKAQIQGRVFRDINASGVFDSTATFREVGVSGITVTAYNSAGVSVATTTTNSTGNYTIPSVSGAARVEFTGLSSTDFAGHLGLGSNTSIQFVNAPVVGVNFGINDPDWYWDTTKDPRYVLPCYVNGAASGSGSPDPALVSLPYSSTGLNVAYQDYNGVQGTGPMPRVDASFGTVGTVWGAAYNKKQKHYYFSTFLKRHCGMADGPGYVYNFDYSGTTATLTGKFNLQGVTPANGGVAIDLGSVTRTGSADYTLATDKGSPSRDIDAFGKVAAMSFGDCDIQPNTDYLWLVNCFQKALIRVNVSSNPTSVPVGGVEQYILSSLPGYPTSTKGVLRPWALKFTSNKGYLGLIDDASNSGNDADLRAIVLEFDPNNISAGFTTKLNFDPNPKRIATGGTWLLYKSWLNTYSEANVIVSGNYRVRAQPVLSDIEFDENGNMYLSFFDRFGHQTGFFNYLPLSGSTTIVRTNSFGEIDIACKTATGWQIEGTGTCYPTTAEFIQDISGDDERESSQGAIALLKGKNQLLQVSIDPHPQGSTGSAYWNTQGTNTYNLTTGAIDNWYSVYQNSSVELFGKANGLGDTELMTDLAPIEIGNRVWADYDKDGIQDAGESGLAGIQLQLYQGATLIQTVTSDANGQYLFTNLLPNTAYQIRINLSQAVLGSVPLSTANVSSNGIDLIDSDMTQSGSTGIINVTTGSYGENNHSFDIGFQIPLPLTACDLGAGNPFNLIVFDASTISNGSDVTGKALFGGNITITGYAVGTSYTSNQGDVLLVNGNLTFNSGQTNWGNVKATGTISGNFTAANGAKIPNTTLGVNVATIRTELETRATYWGTLANQNGTATLAGTGLLTLDCLNSTGQVIFNITAAQIATCWGVEIINGANAQGILINVSGTSVVFSSKALNTYPSQTKIVWNFYQATTIDINSIGLKGTVLAPFAAATFNNGHVDGNVIFRTISGNGETHNYLFNGSLPCVCANVTSAGTIATNQSGCAASLDPSLLTSLTAASGGSGTLEYQWQISADNATWADISGATTTTYDPTSITATRYYRRNARRAPCAWLNSNVVTVSVNPVPTVAPTANTPCMPDTLILRANATVSSGTITNYAWVGPSSGWTSSLTNPRRMAGDVGATGVYTLTVTSSGGCTASGTVNVTATNSFTVSNIPAAATVQCTSNIPTTNPTFVANCCNPVTVQQYNTYPNCPNPNTVTNNGFETVGTAAFASTFQGYPAQQLVNNSTVIPNWTMGFSNCTPSCSPGYWVYDNTNTINNPEGSRFIYLGGGNTGGYCAVSNSTIALAANECAEICFNGAAWATSGLQVPTALNLEYSLNGSNTSVTAFKINLPPSTSFQNLNWQDICLNFIAPSAGIYNFVFTVETEDASNPAAGMALDNIRVKKCCTTNPNPTSCNYTFTKNWLATDNCDDQYLVTQQITVNDMQAPTLSGVPADVTVCTTPPSVATVTATDNCQGAITPVYTQTSTQTSNGSCTDNNYTLTRKWTATDACGNATTGTQIITIVTPSVSISGGATICTGGSLTLSAAINCSLIGVYQWQYWNGTSWINIGTNSSTYNTGALITTTQYRVLFTTTTGSCEATAITTTVTVVPDPSVSVTVPPANVCVGANIILTATPTVGTGSCTVQWQSSPDGTTWTNISGATGNTYNVINLSATTRYRAQLVSCTGNGCCN